jgi:hypothetical protein
MLEIWPMLPVTMSSSTTAWLGCFFISYGSILAPSGIITISTQSGVEA